MPPKVSVIINCRNGEKHLQETLESLRSQTFRDYELVFWDNCSDDRTADIAKTFDSRLRYFKGETPVPLGKARNLAISKASGEYIAFLDSDDLWVENKLELQIDILDKNQEIGMVCSNYTRLNMLTEKRWDEDIFEDDRRLKFPEFADRYDFCLSTFLIRHKVLDDLDYCFDNSLEYAEEYDLFMRIALTTDTQYLRKSLTTYRIHEGMSSIRLQERIGAEYNACLHSLEVMEPDLRKKYPDVVQRIEFNRDFWDAKYLTSIGKCREVRRLMKRYMDYNYRAAFLYINALLPSVAAKAIYKIIYRKKGF